MTDFIFHSKDGQDEYINMLAQGVGQTPVNEVDYDASNKPIVLRGILKHKIMKRCWEDKRDFYYVDTGYFGNSRWKQWHRIVKNNLQLTEIQPRPGDRWEKHRIKFQPWQHGRTIVVAAPDKKPCKFYNIDLNNWIEQTVATIRQHTDRPVVVRQRAPKRIDRLTTDTLAAALTDAHALVTFNSNAATESILLGVPVFTLAPNAAGPVGLQDLTQIETPYYPDHDELYVWASSLAYGQVHVEEMKNGTALEIIKL
jgi:hypothetical protein